MREVLEEGREGRTSDVGTRGGVGSGHDDDGGRSRTVYAVYHSVGSQRENEEGETREEAWVPALNPGSKLDASA